MEILVIVQRCLFSLSYETIWYFNHKEMRTVTIKRARGQGEKTVDAVNIHQQTKEQRPTGRWIQDGYDKKMQRLICHELGTKKTGIKLIPFRPRPGSRHPGAHEHSRYVLPREGVPCLRSLVALGHERDVELL